MKTQLIFFSLCIFFSGKNLFAQTDQFDRDFSSIKTELTNWDPVRGEWLANSMVAMAKNENIPSRTFPEDFTPFEMLNKVPLDQRERIKTTSNSNRTNPTNAQSSQLWNFIYQLLVRTSCSSVSGRSYGDPHFNSFDGNSYSLQSVGEFTLAKSEDGYVNIQARQSPNSDDFALNTALAMNVGGDRLCFYSNEKPDSDISTPIRLNGQPIRVVSSTYLLPHGGTIRSNGNEYIITWPSGEKVSARMSSGQRFNTMNVTTLIYPCAMSGYEGLLGNANGNPKDDLSARGKASTQPDLYASMSKYNTVFGNGTFSDANNRGEKEFLDKLTRDFGNSWRINDLTSLFDYAPGQNTASFTDFTFPRVHRTVGDLSTKQRDKAHQLCKNQGIRDEDMRGCIFDNAYMNIPPAPRPTMPDHSRDIVLHPIERPIPISSPTPLPNSNTSVPIGNTTIGNQGKDGVPDKPQPNAQTIEKPQSTTPQKQTYEKPAPIIKEPINKPIQIFGGQILKPNSNTQSTNSPAKVVLPSSTSKPSNPVPVKPSGTISLPPPSTIPATLKKGG